MNGFIVFGLFSLYVAAMSLYLVLSGRHDPLLALLRRMWGRTLGHSLYFVGRVALPLLICILCLGWGVRHYEPTRALSSGDTRLTLNLDHFRARLQELQRLQGADSEEILGA